MSADLAALGTAIDEVERAGANVLHVDVMDGHFVPNITFGPSWVEAVRRRSHVPLDVHLMIAEPLRYFEVFARAGGDTLVFHAEATEDPRALARRARELGVRVGVAIRPETPVDSIGPILDEVDELTVMSVHPGFSGQTFIPEVLPKIRAARAALDAAGLDLELSVDGGVTTETAPGCVAAGATFLVCGNSVFGHGNVPQNLADLRAAAERGQPGHHEVR